MIIAEVAVNLLHNTAEKCRIGIRTKLYNKKEGEYMRAKHSIVINGRSYDAVTGMPLSDAAPAKPVVERGETVTVTVKHPTTRTPAKTAHHQPHRSTTLRRDIVKKPAGSHDHAAKHTPHHAHVAKSPMVQKFAPHPAGATHAHETQHVPVKVPVVVAKAHHAAHKRHETKPALSSRELKDHLIKQQLEHAPVKHAPHKAKKTRQPLRVSSIMAACFGVMVLGGYLSYINMPNLSVRVAAAQAGVDAQYPGYTPSGYRFDGPVSYSNGQVLLTFSANGGTSNYKINQQKSSWDSQAVLDNYVAAKTDTYDVNDTQGLTVYTYGNNAAWVNHGVLYTISGNAPLKTEQVVKIATSL